MEANEHIIKLQDQNSKCLSNYRPQPVSGPYGLDQALLEDIETHPVSYTHPKLKEFDLHFLREPNKV